MSTTVGHLLDVYRTRLAMQEDDVTNLPRHVKHLTKLLVKKLSQRLKSEEIEIIVEDGVCAKFVLASTGEVLAKMNLEK